MFSCQKRNSNLILTDNESEKNTRKRSVISHACLIYKIYKQYTSFYLFSIFRSLSTTIGGRVFVMRIHVIAQVTTLGALKIADGTLSTDATFTHVILDLAGILVFGVAFRTQIPRLAVRIDNHQHLRLGLGQQHVVFVVICKWEAGKLVV